jgi:hypothetical protein
MNHFKALVLASLLPTISTAEPLVTITCHEPAGVSMQYGVSRSELVKAAMDGKPEPEPSFKGPTKDEYLMNPTFVVDSSKKKVTISWAESASDQELRKQAKELNLLPPSPPPPATEASVLMFMPDQISALEVKPPNATTIYSFFPRLGTAFFTTQAHELGGRNTQQMAVFSLCEFSWSK